jgi:bacteriocin-like protein
MKTNFGKRNSQVKNGMEVLSEKEMKEVQGGLRYIAIRDEDGNIRVIIVP